VCVSHLSINVTSPENTTCGRNIVSLSERSTSWVGSLNFYDTPLSLYCAGEKYYRGEGLWGLDVQMVEAGGRSAVWDEWNGMDA
jgi:hypothetical protein